MQNTRNSFQNYISLFIPSALSTVFIVFLSLAIIGLNQFDAFKQYLMFPNNFDLFRTIAVWVDHVLTSVFGQSRLQTIVVGGFWAIVGLVVYLFLRNLARVVTELDDDIEVRKFVWPKGADRTRPLRIWLEQTIFRIAALIGLAVFAFGPLARLLKGPVLVEFLGDNKIIQLVFWFFANLFILHVMTIMIRLVVLKSRVFE